MFGGIRFYCFPFRSITMRASSVAAQGSPTKSMPVYSDFSHMTAKQGIGGIKFAVGLREDNPDELIARVFPMTKIVPG
eukprot:gene14345-16480_t